MNKDPVTVIMYVLGVVIVIGVLLLAAEAIIFTSVSEDKTIVVDKKIGQPSGSTQYYITDTDGNEYVLGDSYGVKNSVDRYDRLQEGCMFTIHTHSLRFAPLHMYPNIITVQQAISAEHVCNNVPVNIPEDKRSVPVWS